VLPAAPGDGSAPVAHIACHQSVGLLLGLTRHAGQAHRYSPHAAPLLLRRDRLEAAAWEAWGQVQRGDVTAADNQPGATSLNGLLASQVFGRDVGDPFAEHMASDVVRRYATKFLGSDLRLGFIGLWVADAEYDSTWHRDTSGVLGTNHREDVDAEREIAILQASRGYCGGRDYLGKTFKWQTALIDEGDPCLFVCPGSHCRYRTPEERQALCFDWDTDGVDDNPVKPLATEVQLKLKRGQSAVWAGSLIHRGRKPADCATRLSLIGNLARADLDLPPVRTATCARVGTSCSERLNSAM
jgi:hypothetical protein